jgi:hypothetical protein
VENMGLKKGMKLVGKFFDGKNVEIAANIWFPNCSWRTECQGERGFVIMVPKKCVRAGAEWHRVSRNAIDGMILS